MNIESLYHLFIQYPIICTDTRRIIPASLFFALKGDNFDANYFAAEALNKGCSYAIVDNVNVAVDNRYILVEDVLATLQSLANYHRRRLAIPILAITGTNGKTTTKELVYRILSEKYTVGVTQGNLNNHIGVPLTLLSMTGKNTFGVVEMGASHIGEIGNLCEIVEPDYGLITNIGKAHLEGFGSLEGIKKAKGELYDYLDQRDGIAFVNTDDLILQSMVRERPLLKTSAYSSSLYKVQIIPSDNQNPFFHFTINNNTQVGTNLLGSYNLNNLLAAIAVGEYMDIDMEHILKAIQSYQPDNNRSQLIKGQNNVIYMDAYNANPSSMKASLLNFSQLNEKNKILILGDMLELGKDSLFEHQQIIQQIKDEGFQQVYLVGSNFMKTKGHHFQCYDTIDKLSGYLINNQVKNYTILMKGSRGIHLERLLNFL